MNGNRITFVSSDGVESSVLAKEGETALRALRRLDPSLLDAPCGGAGTCGKCRVRVLRGDAGAPDPEELRRLNRAELDAGIRLACRLAPTHDLLLGPVAAGGNGTAVIRESFASIVGVPAPRVLEAGTYGVAIDIGTTTVAAYLVEFAPMGHDTGSAARVISSTSCLNSQRTYGADVIARIDHTLRAKDGLSELASLIRADVRRLIDSLVTEINAAPATLREISVVGNTTMLHLFAAVDPAGIATAPFTPAFVEARRGPATDYGLPYPRAELLLAPSVAGYVGADLVAAAAAVGLEQKEKPCLLLDLGTNGEMALGDRFGVTACATAAGPAFEGAAISCGLGGVAGAVDRLDWDASGRLAYTTIADAPAIGICGSGIIDAAACLIRASLADDTGALVDPWATNGYPLAPGSGGHLRFTQADVRQIQLAKAAVAAGIATMLRDRGLDYEDIDTVYLAGGFGSYLRPESAAAIGLIPPPLLSKVEAVGNAAGHGAVRLLLFKHEIERLRNLARSIRYIELSGDPFFSERYIEEMFFPAPDAVSPAVKPAIGEVAG